MIFLCAVIFTIIKHIALHYTRIQSILNKIQLHQTAPTADNITNYEFQHITTSANWKFKLLCPLWWKGAERFHNTHTLPNQYHNSHPFTTTPEVATFPSLWNRSSQLDLEVNNGGRAFRLRCAQTRVPNLRTSGLWRWMGCELDCSVGTCLATWSSPNFCQPSNTEERELSWVPFQKRPITGWYMCFYMEGSLVISRPQVIIWEHNL